MTYRVYIKKDYKPEVTWVGESSKRWHLGKLVALALLIVSGWFTLGMKQPKTINTPEIDSPKPIASDITEVPNQEEPIFDTSISSTDEIETVYVDETSMPHEIENGFDEIEKPENFVSIEDQETKINEEFTAEIPEQNWLRVTVKNGDSLALIFSRLGLSPNSLYRLMSLGKDVSRLKKLKPGQVLNFQIEDNELLGLEYEMDLTNTLKVSKQDGKFLAEKIHIELESTVKHANAVIKDSLFLSGKRAGLTDNLIMQLVSIYGWDIDFALDIREGDTFTVIYEEQYKDGVKVADGPIIAAEFINRNNIIRTVRYTHSDGSVDYYADNGDAMRKAFIRTPVEFARISSRFNLKRKHPILNKFRAHKGVDYAAPTGTPIKATGDGTVAFAGKKGGYGRTIILKHGGTYSTLYAHLHKYANGVRTGKRVKQGQIIGYVGKSGLATGPHLHYEFRVNGVHRNPLTVKLPKVESISKKQLAEFQKKVTPMLAELDRLTGRNVVASQQTELAANETPSLMEDG